MKKDRGQLYMKINKIYFFLFFCLVFNMFLFASNDSIEMKSADKYGKVQTNTFKNISDNFYKLNIKEIKDISPTMLPNINSIISDLDNFIKFYPTSELTYRVYFALGELYFFKAIAIFKRNNIKTEEFFVNIKTALYYYDKASSLKSDLFFKQNISYRIIECYFALNDFQKTFQLSKNYSENYLTLDTLYIMTVNYMNISKKIGMNEENWKFIKYILNNISTVNMDEVNLKKLYLSSGLTDFIMGGYEDSIYKLKKVDTEDAQFYLGKAYEQLGKYVLAIGEYKSLSLRNPNTKYSRFLDFSIGDCFYKMKNYEESLKSFFDYKIKYVNDEYNIFVDYKIACSYFYMNNYDKAVEFFDKVKMANKKDLKIDKKELELIILYSLYLKAYSYYKNNNYNESAKSFIECYTKFSTEYLGKKSVFMAAWSLYKIGDYVNAEKLILSFQKDNIDESVLSIYMYYLLANIQKENKNYQGALQNYQKTVDKILSFNLKNLYDLRDNSLLMMLQINYLENNFVRISTEFHYILNNIIPKIDNSSTRVEIYLIVADSCFRMKYFKEAKSLYKKIADECKNNDIFYAKAMDGMAWCEYGQNNYVLAEKYRNIISDIILNTKENMDKLKSENFYELGNINFSRKNYIGAIENYEKFVNLADNSEKLPEALYRLGNCYYREEYYSTAIEKWNEILEKYPKYESTLSVAYKIADTYYKSGKYMDAIKIYEHIFLNFDHNISEVMESKLRIAQSFFNDKQYDKAIEKFKEFILEYPDKEKSKEVIDQIENTIYRKQEYKAYQKGLKVAEISIAEDFENTFKDFVDTNKSLKITTDIIYKIASNNFEESRYESAMVWYNKFFSLGNYSDFDKDKVATAQYNLAEIYYILKRYNEAIKNYELILSGFKDSKFLEKAYVRLGTSYLNIKNYNKAINVYENLLILNPKTEYASLVNYNLGVSYKEIEDFKKSNGYFINYYNMNKDNIDALQLMIDVGDNYLKIREYMRAVFVYKMIIDKLDDSQKIYVQYKIGESFEKEFKDKEAIEEYAKLIQVEPKENVTRLSGIIKLGELYKNNKLYKESYDAFKEVYNSTTNVQWKNIMNSKMAELETLISQKTA